MYTQHARIKGNPEGRTDRAEYLETLEKPGPTVRLLSQSAEGVTYAGEDGEPVSCSAFEFFSTFREATRAECDKAERPAPGGGADAYGEISQAVSKAVEEVKAAAAAEIKAIKAEAAAELKAVKEAGAEGVKTVKAAGADETKALKTVGGEQVKAVKDAAKG